MHKYLKIKLLKKFKEELDELHKLYEIGMSTKDYDIASMYVELSFIQEKIVNLIRDEWIAKYGTDIDLEVAK